MLAWDGLRIFLAVHRTRSHAGAARLLRVASTTPALPAFLAAHPGLDVAVRADIRALDLTRGEGVGAGRSGVAVARAARGRGLTAGVTATPRPMPR